MHEQHHDPGPSMRAPGQRPAFAAPRLELPRFQFAPTSTIAPDAAAPPRSQPQPQPPPQPHSQPQPQHVVARSVSQHHPAPLMAPTARAAVQHQPGWQQPVRQQPIPHAASQLRHAQAPGPWTNPTSVQRPPASARNISTATPTRPAAVTWAPSPSEPTLLQRITPVHMGALLMMVIVAMVVTSGPAAMSAKPARLPALASGAGAGGDPLLAPRAGDTAVQAATGAGAKATGAKGARTPARAKAAPVVDPAAAKAAATRRSRARIAARTWIIVGSGRVRRQVRAGGIPSPAAAANLAVAGGGRVSAGATGNVNLNGIPSAAAAERLGPQTLPYRPNDGVTLPRMVGERDSHALDSHYGADVLPMEAVVATPALTPGDAAAQAQHRVAVQDLTGGSAAAPSVNGGLVVAH